MRDRTVDLDQAASSIARPHVQCNGQGLSTSNFPPDLFLRDHGIGGSDANIRLSGDAGRIHQLWLEKRGESEAADLTGNLAVMLGCWTEPFNRQWFEQLAGRRITDTGATFTCRVNDWRRCTVDGLI